MLDTDTCYRHGTQRYLLHEKRLEKQNHEAKSEKGPFLIVFIFAFHMYFNKMLLVKSWKRGTAI